MNKKSGLSTLPSVIMTGIDNRLKDLHTSMPGIIKEFDPVTQLAKVQPAIKRVFKTEDNNGDEILNPQNLPILINVPVQFPRGGGFSITFPVKPEDECLLVFCERAIDNWHRTGESKKPNAKRFHSLSDATCFVGISSEPKKVPNYSADDVQLKKDGHEVYITLKNNNDLELHTDTNMTATIGGNLTATVGDSLTATIENDVSVTSTSGDIETIATAGNINVTATSGNVVVTAATNVDVTATTINLNGNVNITGNTVFTGTMTANGKVVDETHTHIGSATAPVGPITPTGVVV